MKDKEIEAKINLVLKKVDDFFKEADVLPASYRKMAEKAQNPDRQFFRELWLNDKNHKFKPNQNMFSFSADEIERYKIPSYVVGCSGRADLFAKYAKEIGLDGVFVVPCVKISDMTKERADGHQVVAVEMEKGLQLINPANDVWHFERAAIEGECKVGEVVDAIKHGTPEYKIAAILTPDEHKKIDSYEKLRAIYARVQNVESQDDMAKRQIMQKALGRRL